MSAKTEARKHTIRDEFDGCRRREFNDEFMQRIMTVGCPAGALIHAFVLEGLRKYAEMCIEAGPERLDNPLVNGKAWVACAQFYLDELKEHQS